MECSQKQIWETIDILPLDETIRSAVKANWDSVAKPLDGLGKLETVTAQIGAVLGSDTLDIQKKAVIVMCADNGIVEEGISQSGQEVTAIVAENMVHGNSSVCKLAKAIKADVIPVDIGIYRAEPIKGMRNQNVRCGTRNFAEEPAMTRQEVCQAIQVGMELVRECKEAGYQILATGEMGIGNTTTSSALITAFLGCSAAAVTGRGAGLDDEKLAKKKRVITDAVERWNLKQADTLTTLACVGGLDIAGLAGVCMGGARYHVPIVLDGIISLAAALAAERLLPGTRDYLIASHKGKEPAVPLLLKELSLDAVIDADMALGEGTGAVMMMALLDLALRVYESRTTFSDIQISPYERYENV